VFVVFGRLTHYVFKEQAKMDMKVVIRETMGMLRRYSKKMSDESQGADHRDGWLGKRTSLL
jgi:hypothetical protein